jgi:hypothetical protein
MMNILSRRTFILRLSFVFAVVFILTPVFFLHGQNIHPHIRNLREKLSIYNDPSREFIEKAFELNAAGEYDSKALTFVCEKTQWTEGLIFSCEGLQGGIGNLRNVLLNCLRFTIEAGGMAICFQKAQKLVWLIIS